MGILPKGVSKVNTPNKEAADLGFAVSPIGGKRLEVYTHSDHVDIVQLDDTDRVWQEFLETIGSHAVAYGLGRADAQDKRSCIPELYFTRRVLQEYYCRGYASHAGHNPTTRWFLKDKE